MTEPFTEIIQPYYHLANTVHPSISMTIAKTNIDSQTHYD